MAILQVGYCRDSTITDRRERSYSSSSIGSKKPRLIAKRMPSIYRFYSEEKVSDSDCRFGKREDGRNGDLAILVDESAQRCVFVLVETH